MDGSWPKLLLFNVLNQCYENIDCELVVLNVGVKKMYMVPYIFYSIKICNDNIVYIF